MLELVNRNLPISKLYEIAIKGEKNSLITSTGALLVLSGEKTGRSPKDKHVIGKNKDIKIWDDSSSPNNRINETTFNINKKTALNFLSSIDTYYVFDGFLGWEEKYSMKIRIFCSRAYHCLFMHNMLIRPTDKELEEFGEPDFVIYNSGSFKSNEIINNSTTNIDLNFDTKEVVILGTEYAGEMKKALFSVMHYYLPLQNVLSLHSSVNESKENGSTTIFFGLSGTGKTSLSADPNRYLIGDDEHGWSDNGVFNIEGGCYAKCINLSKEKEPEIFRAISFGAVLENTICDNKRVVDYSNTSITENTRACYPIYHIENAKIPCKGKHPTNIILLTCDCFGVLPPISKLTPEEVMFYFINGYTSKIPGTEQGVVEPEVTFSSCFGEAFIIFHPIIYAKMLADKIKKYNADAWLVNTGWTSGKYGEGKRINISYTRTIIDAIHSGQIHKSEWDNLPVFNLKFPKNCSHVPEDILNPRKSWKDSNKYYSNLTTLAKLFISNFKKYEAEINTLENKDALLKCIPSLEI